MSVSKSVEAAARERAAVHGGKFAYKPPGGMWRTNAYLAGRREGWWRWGAGVHTPELIDEYVDRHWRDFTTERNRPI